MTDEFEPLLEAGESADVSGWDFFWLEGRTKEERPPWCYARQLADRLNRASASLDIQTGGGEVLADWPTTYILGAKWALRRGVWIGAEPLRKPHLTRDFVAFRCCLMLLWS